MFRVIAFMLIVGPAVAETVYKTVEDGVPTFSDTPPSRGSAEVLSVEVPVAADDDLLRQRLAAMRETTDRMVSDRRQREKHRAELRALIPAQPATAVEAGGEVAWNGYSYWPSYTHPARPRPPYRPGRPHPMPRGVAEPPAGWSVMQPGNSQLMRPILSSRP